MAESWKDGVYPELRFKVQAAHRAAPDGDTKEALNAALESSLAVTDFGAIVDHFRVAVDDQTGGKFGDSTSAELPEEMGESMDLIIERYEEYLASFGEGEAELKKKVEQELGWSLLQLKQRVAGGVGSSWSAMPVFGTSGMAGSIIDHRSIGGEKPV
mmetsp:Transcript_22599/g.69818  ORF Transcript_22599/g.69818 Transcript_22599/m.69818 type:complete len:157 (-) Transcript_22599:226-696(-)